MAGNEDRKAELIAQLARARQQIDASGGAVRHALDVPARVRSGFQRHAFLWIGGAVLVGVLLAKLPPRTRKVYVDEEGERVKLPKAGKAGLLLAGSKIAFDLLRPLLSKWIASQATPLVEQWLARYMPAARDSHDHHS